MQVGKEGAGVYGKALSKVGGCGILVESYGEIESQCFLGGTASAVGKSF
jgi:hypothetical protein